MLPILAPVVLTAGLLFVCYRDAENTSSTSDEGQPNENNFQNGNPWSPISSSPNVALSSSARLFRPLNGFQDVCVGDSVGVCHLGQLPDDVLDSGSRDHWASDLVGQHFCARYRELSPYFSSPEATINYIVHDEILREFPESRPFVVSYKEGEGDTRTLMRVTGQQIADAFTKRVQEEFLPHQP